jgi:hypothetical protein
MRKKTPLQVLVEMHRYLYEEQYDGKNRRLKRADYREPTQWHAGTIEGIASMLNEYLGNDGEGRERT